MKINLPIVACLLFVIPLMAQEKGSITTFISAGPNMPFGTYNTGHSTNYNFTSTGFTASAGGIYWLNKHIGTTVSMHYNLLALDAQRAAQNIAEENLSTKKVSIQTGSYHMTAVTIGLTYKKNLSQQFSLLPKIEAGAVQIFTPRITQFLSTEPLTDITVSKGSATGFIYGAGLAAQYTINKKWSTALTADYFATSIKLQVAEKDSYTQIKQKPSYLAIAIQVSMRIR
jgi:hypothetical protein